MKYNNVQLVTEIPFEAYDMLVNVIVDIQTNTGQYRPQEYTYFRPAMIMSFCLDGIELEGGESLFNPEVMHAAMKAPEVCEVIDFSRVDDCWIYGLPAFYYNAESDAEELIEQWLKGREPANSLVLAIADVAEKAAKVMDGMDAEQFISLLSAAVMNLNNGTQPVASHTVDIKQAVETKPKRTRRKTTKKVETD